MRRLNLNFYHRNLIIMFMVTCLPMAIIAISNYFVGVGQIESEINRNQQLQLKQINQTMENQLSHLETVGNQWGFNPIFNAELTEGDLRRKPNTARDLLASLRILKESNPLIGNAVLYLAKDNLVISDDEGINEITDEAAKRTYQKLLDRKPTLFWWEEPVSPLKYQSKVNMALIHKVKGLEGAPYGAIILFLEKKRLDEILSPLNPDGQGAAFILNDNGEWVTNGRTEGGESSGLDEAVRTEAISRWQTGDDVLLKLKGASYSVTIGNVSRIGWKYVIATPISRLTAPVILVSKLGLAVSLLGLAIAAVLTWLASRSIYRPVKQLVGLFKDGGGGATSADRKNEFQFIEGKWRTLIHESRRLHAKLEQSSQTLKEGFFLQLVQGHMGFFTEMELKERMSLHGWGTEGKCFAIMLLRMDGIAGAKGKFQEGDEQLATFAAVNIAQDVFRSRSLDAEVVNFHDLSFAVVLSFPVERTKEQVKSDLFHLSGELIDILTRFTQLRFTVGVGKLVYLVQDIHKSLDEAREAMRFRDLDKNEQIIDMDNVLPQETAQVHYPFEAEAAIIQAMKLGMEKEAGNLLKRFVEELRQSQGKELLFQQGMLQLLGSILHALLKWGTNPAALLRGGNLYEQLGAMKAPEEMLRWMKMRIIKPYIEELSHTREMMIQRIVGRVIDTIRDRYASPISLESCADENGVTSYNLSKEFKHCTGMNFIDFLTNTRLEKAKELLLSTDLKMNDIAERIGYQPTYFIRIFKKIEGVTPGRYREIHADGGSANP